MGASLRSIAGSPAWTAIVSGCGIGSAYLTPLVATQLEPIAQPFKNRKAFLELGVIAGEERTLTADACRIGHGTHRVPEVQRARQHIAVAFDHPESAPRLCLQGAKVSPFRKSEELRQPLGPWRVPGVEQQVEASLSAFGQTGTRPGHVANGLRDGPQIGGPVPEPPPEVTVGRKGHQDGVKNLAGGVGAPILLASVGHVDGSHEPAGRVARRRLPRLEPELADPLTHLERFVPATEQRQNIGPPDNEMQRRGWK